MLNLKKVPIVGWRGKFEMALATYVAGKAFVESGKPVSVSCDGKVLIGEEKLRHGNMKSVRLFGRTYEIALEEAVETDNLTDLLNRNGISKKITQIIEGTKKDKETAFVFVDLDDFKSVNDTYGHEKGDEVLRNVGALLNRSFRDSDFVVRWGGEEILIILPNTPEISVRPKLERVRNEIASMQFNDSVNGTDFFNITASMGVASFLNEGNVVDSQQAFQDVVNKADMAMYTSKRAGKNRITSVSGYTTPISEIGSRASDTQKVIVERRRQEL